PPIRATSRRRKNSACAPATSDGRAKAARAPARPSRRASSMSSARISTTSPTSLASDRRTKYVPGAAQHPASAELGSANRPPAAAASYLAIDKIIAAATYTGAEAVHPGYGFLSERAEFAEALTRAGIVFIGPHPQAIAAMGDKIAAKLAAAKAKVSTVPGHLG